jgi:sensor histidine kinase YesM
MKTLNDRWLRLAGIPLMAVLGQWLFFDSRGIAMHQSVWVRYGLSIVTVSMLWELFRVAIRYARWRYPNAGQEGRRISLQLLLFVLATVAVRLLMTVVSDQLGLRPFPPLSRFAYYVLITLLSMIPIAAIYEVVYFYQRWKATYVEAEELRKINLQVQIESLLTQVNPHFLFNNLNALSSLIQTNPKQAGIFLDELSSVYRYLLQINHAPVGTLRQEVQFIRAYIHLLQTRFGAALTVQVNVPDRWLSHHIPTLSLQTLLDNALKHNVASVSRPLLVCIDVQDGQLVVENNVQKKTLAVATRRGGLDTLFQKYQLLNQPTAEVIETTDTFRVALPLLEPAFAHE